MTKIKNPKYSIHDIENKLLLHPKKLKNDRRQLFDTKFNKQNKAKKISFGLGYGYQGREKVILYDNINAKFKEV